MAATWRVVSQRHTEDLTTSGAFIGVWEVTFETIPGGTVGVIKVPDRIYSADVVRAEIEAKAAQLAAIEDMTNG
jgi:hypothetical protein